MTTLLQTSVALATEQVRTLQEDAEDWEACGGKPVAQVQALKPTIAMRAVEHMYVLGQVPKKKAVADALVTLLGPAVRDDHGYVKRVMKAAKAASTDRHTQNLSALPRYIEALRAKGHHASMTAHPLEEMKDVAAGVINKEWERRRHVDPSLPEVPSSDMPVTHHGRRCN